MTGQDFVVRVNPDDRVEDLKDLILASTGCPRWDQRLMFEGQRLEEGQSLGGYHGMECQDTVFMFREQRGGGGPMSFSDVSNAGAGP